MESRREVIPANLSPAAAPSTSGHAPEQKDGGVQDCHDADNANATLNLVDLDEDTEMLFGVSVVGTFMDVPQPYDPDTYELNRTVPRTPEAAARHGETYAAWGREYFGEEWFQQRRTMLCERNIYRFDPVYLERQRRLRIIEHQREQRPFHPVVIHKGNERDNLDDDGWQRVWVRLAKSLGLSSERPPEDPVPSPGGSNSSRGTGYSTFPPTPEFRPFPEDPLELLDHHREQLGWSDEEYHFHLFYDKQTLVDEERTDREDGDGNRRLEQEKKDISELQRSSTLNIAERWPRWVEWKRRLKRFDLLRDGLTVGEVDSMERVDRLGIDPAEFRDSNDYRQLFPLEPAFPAQTQDDMDEWFRLSDAHGISRPIQARLAHLWGYRSPGPSSRQSSVVSLTMTSPSPPRSPPRSPLRNDSDRGTHIGRVTRSASARANSDRRDTAPRRPNETETKTTTATTTNAQRRIARGPGGSASTTKSAPSSGAPRRRARQRKSYTKERASRRITGEPPEFGLLPEGPKKARHKLQLSALEPVLSKTVTGASAARGGRRTTGKTPVTGSKPQCVSKAKGRAGVNRRGQSNR